MPADINPAGDIFGGLADGAYGPGGREHRPAPGARPRRDRRRRRHDLPQPGQVGDEVELLRQLIGETGRTSMKIEIEAWRPAAGDVSSRVTAAVFTFVAGGADRRPRALPEIHQGGCPDEDNAMTFPGHHPRLRAGAAGCAGPLEANAPLAPLSWFRTGGPRRSCSRPRTGLTSSCSWPLAADAFPGW